MLISKSKQLLVEGVDDRGAVIGLMKHHVEWADNKWPVFIDAVGSVEEILDKAYLNTKLKESGLEILGVMIDADDKPDSRWEHIHSICQPLFPSLPDALPKGGLVVDGPTGLRFGLWMMPDCESSGMLESFLRYMVPTHAEPLWNHAKSSFAGAKAIGSSCRDAHVDKAHIHTWLAWQDPPGERLGIAITKKMLDPQASTAAPFVNWFRELYRV